ncbi:MAG: hypothetical protein ACLFOY_04910 [Desulfatibacillaceae bacterium]
MAEEQDDKRLEASEEQVLYARILDKGMSLGLIILFITFFIYVFGILDPYVPRDQLTELWTHNVGTYLHETDVEAGWWWVTKVSSGDFLNFIGIALLAGVTIICYIAIVPVLWKNDDKLYAVIAILEALVLCLAASGILGVGGH